jgi:hypothetical protein
MTRQVAHLMREPNRQQASAYGADHGAGAGKIR